MLNELLNINEIEKYSSLTPKQIRNNIRDLHKHPEYQKKIYGGGRGKGGRYQIHFSLLPKITMRRRRRKIKDIQTIRKHRLLAEHIFPKIQWDYFGCIKPNIEIDMEVLICSISNFNCFYAIHRQNEMNHIHFTLEGKNSMDKIITTITNFYKRNKISIDNVFLKPFDKSSKRSAFNYLLRKEMHSNRNDLIDWGLINFQD